MKPNSTEGATLVEMMVASAIMLLVLSGIINGFTAARRSSVLAADQLKAMHAVRQGMEILSSYAYTDSRLNPGTRTLPELGMSNAYVVTSATNAGSTKNVSVTVYWKTPGINTILSSTCDSSFTLGLHRN